MISALQHPNLVKLYGCCIEGNQLLLVYEYLENNSLARALFGKCFRYIFHCNLFHFMLMRLLVINVSWFFILRRRGAPTALGLADTDEDMLGNC